MSETIERFLRKALDEYMLHLVKAGYSHSFRRVGYRHCAMFCLFILGKQVPNRDARLPGGWREDEEQ